MKKILVITPRFPYPVIGGDRLRIYEICKELSRKYSLTLVSLCESNEEMTYPIPDDGVYTSVYRCHHPRIISYFSCLLALPTNIPLQVAYYYSPKFKKIINKLVPEHDLLLPHLIRVAGYVKKNSTPKILEMTDAISMNYERVCKLKNSTGIKGLIYKIERNRLNQYEKSIAKYFDQTIFVSQHDKKYLFRNLPDLYHKSLVCTNGVDVANFKNTLFKRSYKLIFIGNMFSVQNFDAAFWFCESVLPILRQYGPFTFHVIGKISLENSKKLSAYEGVFVTGAVDNVMDYANNSLAGICSVRLAAGVQNKILEYMAMGIPAITTSIGLEGLFAVDGESIVVANTPHEFVSTILKLFNDPSFGKTISKNGLGYVQQNHSWSEKLQPLIQVINNLIEE
ncbi:glycosyltransferase [Escherichia coli]|uniref:glycosyltransferase n=2 Tax=Escherichia coli TaxID=562 RepID=UPI000985B070|nr:glycosyltransferase [Escherichia coli]HCK39961.1 glycosyl transferase family 1 [Shigella sp.]EAA2068844.1 glycosyl transferase family 1 [Escherichia coli]EEV9161934.1 glycosyltransferase [Escherichia coli]EEV9242796.1 glycosyltransferase [Escherichia coli]EEY6130387.1 glycosyltransferase [Escherichia coli]